MASDLAQRYFNDIRSAWKPFASSRTIIPFCTPVFQSPTSLVIGMNHSDFVPGGGSESTRISDDLSNNPPTENTFLVHDHKFSIGIRGVCERAGIELSDKWMGTNRCAVQTGPAGVSELIDNDAYESCQKQMDDTLRRLVNEIEPKNVILVGKFASVLFYPNAESCKFEELQPRMELLGDAGAKTMLIPIMHVSRGSFWKMGAERLREHYIQ